MSEISVSCISIPTKEKLCDSYFALRDLHTVIWILYWYQISLLTSLVLATLFMMLVLIGQILTVMKMLVCPLLSSDRYCLLQGQYSVAEKTV